MTAARLLAVMGSGETSPTMVKTHRALFEQLDSDTSAVLLDTPFGFQENADDIAARAVEYFGASVGRRITVAQLRSADADAMSRQRAIEAVRAAAFVFSGPGSPSYALRQWRDTPVPELLAAKLRDGGCVCFASAAALTLGIATVPVYEIYKVGDEPRWLDGLNLLSEFGVRAAVIPHFDNAEGGNHDTRFCYLGERRLRMLEEQLPDDAFVLGVDEHTACVFDLVAGTFEVTGLGAVTVRRRGSQRLFASGETFAIGELSSAQGSVRISEPRRDPDPDRSERPLVEAAHRLDAEFSAALERDDVAGAVAAVVALDAEITAWAADTLQSDEQDRARETLRSMLVRLGDAASRLSGRAGLVGPLVDALLAARAQARIDGRYDDADRLRDQVAELGIEVRDGPEGSSWHLPS